MGTFPGVINVTQSIRMRVCTGFSQGEVEMALGTCGNGDDKMNFCQILPLILQKEKGKFAESRHEVLPLAERVSGADWRRLCGAGVCRYRPYPMPQSRLKRGRRGRNTAFR